MRKEIAQGLGPLVKNIKLYHALVDYTKERIAWHKDQLAIAKNIEEVREHQGSIKALTRFSTLNEEVTSVLKKD